MGRFAEIAADVHAIVLSSAVEAPGRNLGHRQNVHLYQADLMLAAVCAVEFSITSTTSACCTTRRTRGRRSTVSCRCSSQAVASRSNAVKRVKSLICSGCDLLEPWCLFRPRCDTATVRAHQAFTRAAVPSRMPAVPTRSSRRASCQPNQSATGLPGSGVARASQIVPGDRVPETENRARVHHGHCDADRHAIATSI